MRKSTTSRTGKAASKPNTKSHQPGRQSTPDGSDDGIYDISQDVTESSADEEREAEVEDGEEAEEDEEDDADKTMKIPEELLTRILHEFFTREDTRISKTANRAVGKYFEIFVQEAIARTAAEREGGARFLEVEDLEKITAQLIMDL